MGLIGIIGLLILLAGLATWLDDFIASPLKTLLFSSPLIGLLAVAIVHSQGDKDGAMKLLIATAVISPVCWFIAARE